MGRKVAMNREHIEYIKDLRNQIEEQADKKYYAIQWRQKYQRLTEPHMEYVEASMARLQELENMIEANTLIYNKLKI